MRLLIGDDGVPGQGQALDAGEEGAGEALDLLQAREGDVGMNGLPSALGVDDLIRLQQAAVHHGLGLLHEVGRDLQALALQVVEGRQVRDPVHVHEGDVVPILFVILEAGQVLEIEDGGEGDVLAHHVPEVGQGEQAVQADLMDAPPRQGRPVVEPGAVIDLQLLHPGHPLQPGKGGEVGAIVQDQPSGIGLVQPLQGADAVEQQLVGHMGEQGHVQPLALVAPAAPVPQLEVSDRGVLDIGQGAAVPIRDVEIAVFFDGGQALPVRHLRDAEGKVFLVLDIPEEVHVVDVGPVQLQVPELGELSHRRQISQGEAFVHAQGLESRAAREGGDVRQVPQAHRKDLPQLPMVLQAAEGTQGVHVMEAQPFQRPAARQEG